MDAQGATAAAGAEHLRFEASRPLRRPAPTGGDGPAIVRPFYRRSPATTLIIMATTNVPKTYDSRAWRVAVLRIDFVVRSVSET